MTDKVFSVFALLGLILVLIPLPWHLHAWNAGTCLFMIWTAIGCLIHFINSIVWAGNAELHSAVWCDISTKLIIGLSVALPCASLCINRRLYLIARISQVHSTKAERWRAVYIDIAIGVGLPMIVMALHYIVQGHRFDIFEGIGCWPATVNMAPAYPLVWMWPILVGLISMVFGGLALRALMRRRIEFNQLLASHQNLNVNRYFRLMALATIEICATTPIAIYFLYLNLTTSPPIPWISLADTHFDFSRITYVPAFIVNSQHQLKLNFDLNRWLFPACAFLFFIFFGLAEEARRHYTRLYHAIVKPFGITPAYRVKIGRPAKFVVGLTPLHTNVGQKSEPVSKWEELSIKMPDIVENPSLVANQHESFHCNNLSVADKAAGDASQYGSHRSTSLYSSNSSLFTAAGSSGPASSSHAPGLPVPTLTVTCGECMVSHLAQATHEPPRRDLSRTSSRHSSHRVSTSSDLEITISPPYFAETNTSLGHEDIPSNSPSSHTAPPNKTNVPHSQPHDRIWMTVETSVV